MRRKSVTCGEKSAASAVIARLSIGLRKRRGMVISGARQAHLHALVAAALSGGNRGAGDAIAAIGSASSTSRRQAPACCAVVAQTASACNIAYRCLRALLLTLRGTVPASERGAAPLLSSSPLHNGARFLPPAVIAGWRWRYVARCIGVTAQHRLGLSAAFLTAARRARAAHLAAHLISR